MNLLLKKTGDFFETNIAEKHRYILDNKSMHILYINISHVHIIYYVCYLLPCYTTYISLKFHIIIILYIFIYKLEIAEKLKLI